MHIQEEKDAKITEKFKKLKRKSLNEELELDNEIIKLNQPYNETEIEER